MLNKMTVGIITMHKVNNYGSALQAYALQKVITDMGYECELIDYIYPNIYHFNKNQLQAYQKTWKSCVKEWFPLKPSWYDAKRKKIKIEKFWKKYYKLNGIKYSTKEELLANPPVFDIYVTGSDQVWNPRFMKGDASFLLSFAPDQAKKIAYASSFACSNIPNKYRERYKKLLSRYSYLSVREQGGTKVVKELLGKDIPVVLDPTLLLTPNDWRLLCPVRKKKVLGEKYILAYVLNYAFNVIPYIYNLIEHVQKETGYAVIFIGSIPNQLKDIAVSAIGLAPSEFLELFENASFVITSSFHGTSFAINYGIPFYTVVNNETENDDRQLNLLKLLNIEYRAISVGEDFSTLNTVWDNEIVQKNLAKHRNLSLSYLKEALIG